MVHGKHTVLHTATIQYCMHTSRNNKIRLCVVHSHQISVYFFFRVCSIHIDYAISRYSHTIPF